MSAKKKSIKNEYAPLFKILYWSMIGFFFAIVIWMAYEVVTTATSGMSKHNRMSEDYREAMERRVLPAPATPNENTTPANDPASENKQSDSPQDEQNEDDESSSK